MADPTPSNNSRERSEAMQLISKKVMEAKNYRMERAITMEEVKNMVFAMPKDKSPGIDGMTIEVLTRC